MAKKVLCSSHVPWIPDRPSSGSLVMLTAIGCASSKVNCLASTASRRRDLRRTRGDQRVHCASMLKVDASDLALTREALYRTLSLERTASGHVAECSQQFPPSDGDCHTPLPCEVRKRKRYHATSVQSCRSRRAEYWLLSTSVVGFGRHCSGAAGSRSAARARAIARWRYNSRTRYAASGFTVIFKREASARRSKMTAPRRRAMSRPVEKTRRASSLLA